MKKTTNRRVFLKKSAGLAAGVVGFPYIVRSSALGMAGSVAPSNRLVMAQIGCGNMGTGNMQGFLELSPEVQVVAVCDVDGDRLLDRKRMVDEKYGNKDCRSYSDYRQLLEREDLDCVSHALPDHGHCPVTLACARKGIDMYGDLYCLFDDRS